MSSTPDNSQANGSPPRHPAAKSATAQLEEDFGGDVEMVLMVVDVFIETVPDLVTKLKAALDKSDLVGAGRGAHSLKGALAQVQDDVGRDLAFTIETACKEGQHATAMAAFPDLEKSVAAVLEEMQTYKKQKR